MSCKVDGAGILETKGLERWSSSHLAVQRITGVKARSPSSRYSGSQVFYSLTSQRNYKATLRHGPKHPKAGSQSRVFPDSPGRAHQSSFMSLLQFLHLKVCVWGAVILTVVVLIGVQDGGQHKDFLWRSTSIHSYCWSKAMGEAVFRKNFILVGTLFSNSYACSRQRSREVFRLMLL